MQQTAASPLLFPLPSLTLSSCRRSKCAYLKTSRSIFFTLCCLINGQWWAKGALNKLIFIDIIFLLVRCLVYIRRARRKEQEREQLAVNCRPVTRYAKCDPMVRTTFIIESRRGKILAKPLSHAHLNIHLLSSRASYLAVCAPACA